MDNTNLDGIKAWIDRFKIPIALSLVGFVLIIGGIFTSGFKASDKKEFPKESLINSQKIISVDVSGAVNRPGVYQLKDGLRIEEAIQAAGGFSETANSEYISKYLNLAQKLSDGTKVYVPFAGESMPSGESTSVAGANTSSKININTASQSELESLPDIASVRASNIISNRPYQKIEGLLDKKIVSKSVFEKIKDQIVVY